MEPQTDPPLVIKCRLGDDIRRIPVFYEKELTYGQLESKIRRIYDDKLRDSDGITIKYTDEGIAVAVIVIVVVDSDSALLTFVLLINRDGVLEAATLASRILEAS